MIDDVLIYQYIYIPIDTNTPIFDCIIMIHYAFFFRGIRTNIS